MKTAITIISLAAFLAAIMLSGCVVTGSAQYTDPKTGATASLGISREFQPRPRSRADSKTIVPRE